MLVAGRGLVGPYPPLYFGHVLAMLPDVTCMLKQLIAELLLDVRSADRKPGDTVDDVDRKMIAIEPVEHDHVERRRGRSLFLETVNMHLGMIGAVIGEAVDQIRVAVISKDHGLVAGEHAVEITVTDAVRMLVLG